MSESQDLPALPKGRPAPPLEEYVAQELAITRASIEQMKVPSGQHVTTKDAEDRLARSERYARWRWQAYQDGEVASL